MTDARKFLVPGDGASRRADQHEDRHVGRPAVRRDPAPAPVGAPRSPAVRSPLAGFAHRAATPAGGAADQGSFVAPVAGRVPPRLGELLVRAGVIDEGQLAAALADQQRSRRPLGEILVERGAPLGAVTKALLKQVRSELNRGRLGELLVELGLATPTQIGEALYRQRIQHVSLGKALIDGGVITLAQLELALEEQHRRDRAAS
jgi:hypothetical protein